MRTEQMINQQQLYKAWIELVSPNYVDGEDSEYIESYFDTEDEAIAWLKDYSQFSDYDHSHCSLGERGISIVERL